MKRRLSYLFGPVLFIFIFGCSNDKDRNNVNVPHDPNQPVTFSTFMPDSGRIAEKFIIKGDNFGNDKSKVKVIFKDVNNKEVNGAIVDVDNQMIYCIVPRQEGGQNEVMIEVAGKSIVADKMFRYSVSENVSTIAGDPSETKDVDGSLSEARLNNMWGVVVLDNETAMVGQAWNGRGVKLISVPDNQVVTVHPGFVTGKMAVTNDKTTVYAVGIVSPHTIYVYEKGAAWTPMRIGEVGSMNSPGDIWSTALDNTEEWLYYIGQNGDFRRVKISDTSVNEMLKQRCVPNGTPFSYIAYSAFEDCFYVTVAQANAIYRVSKDGQTVDQINQVTLPGNVDGYLSDAKFEEMLGLTVDDDGNIYIVQRKTPVIRKISLNDGYVKTVVGIPGKEGADDGSPKVALLDVPTDICYDGKGGFWIVSCWRATVRKYAVE